MYRNAEECADESIVLNGCLCGCRRKRLGLVYKQNRRNAYARFTMRVSTNLNYLEPSQPLLPFLADALGNVESLVE